VKSLKLNTMRNQVQLIGNLGMIPEITNFESGAKKVRFTLATNEVYTDKNGEKQKKTAWHNLYAWGATANYIAKAGKKGTPLAISGKMVTQRYKSKNGEPKAFTAIEVQRALAL
jgi:single-strand DNA-binding protein